MLSWAPHISLFWLPVEFSRGRRTVQDISLHCRASLFTDARIPEVMRGMVRDIGPHSNTLEISPRHTLLRVLRAVSKIRNRHRIRKQKLSLYNKKQAIWATPWDGLHMAHIFEKMCHMGAKLTMQKCVEKISGSSGIDKKYVVEKLYLSDSWWRFKS